MIWDSAKEDQLILLAEALATCRGRKAESFKVLAVCKVKKVMEERRKLEISDRSWNLEIYEWKVFEHNYKEGRENSEA